ALLPRPASSGPSRTCPRIRRSRRSASRPRSAREREPSGRERENAPTIHHRAGEERSDGGRAPGETQRLEQKERKSDAGNGVVSNGLPSLRKSLSLCVSVVNSVGIPLSHVARVRSTRSFFLEIQARGIDAIALVRRAGAVIEDVAQVPFAARA